MNFRNIVKKLTPPIVFDSLKRDRVQKSADGLILPAWHGNFGTWAEAIQTTKGYNDDLILETVRTALLKVKNGDAVYERDSVLFDEVQYSWPLLSFLLKAALEKKGSLNVIDFGGSLGSSYFQNKDMLNLGDALKWNIIEQKHFVDCGQKDFQNGSLRFYYDLETCLQENNPDVLLVSGVLQYLPDPYQWISVFNQLDLLYIIADRTAFTDSEKEFIKIQNTSETSDYPAWFLNKKKFIKAFDRYKLSCEFPDHSTPPVVIDDRYCYWAGLVFSDKQR